MSLLALWRNALVQFVALRCVESLVFVVLDVGSSDLGFLTVLFQASPEAGHIESVFNEPEPENVLVAGLAKRTKTIDQSYDVFRKAKVPSLWVGLYA